MVISMKKYLLVGGAVLALVVVAVIVFLVKGADGLPSSGTEKNYGLSHVDMVIDANGAYAFNVNDYVPGKDMLVTNLKEAGYEVKSESVQFSEGITGERIMASKGESFCSIVYGLDVEEAAVVFKDYEKEYSEEDYFVLAQNEQFVYCMSDKKAFDGAGFTKLGTSGVLFVNYGNK